MKEEQNTKVLSRTAPASLWRDAMRRLFKNRAATISFIFIGIVSIAALLAPLISPFSYEYQDIQRLLLQPNAINWMGTDSLGRDLLSRVIYGAQMSMAVGLIAAFTSLVIGTIYGTISGYVGGNVDNFMMRIVDIVNTLPDMVILILLGMIFGRSFIGIIMSLSTVGWLLSARIVRGQVLQVKQFAYIEAARAVGVAGPGIVIKHVIPNILGPIIVTLTFQIPGSIMSESFLSFVGLGLQPPYSSWGTLANEGWRALQSFPHLILFPGLAIFLTCLAFNFFGDGLRDAIDPQLKNL